MNEKTFKKTNIKIVNKQIVRYPCTKFQLIWRTSDFETKFPQKNMTDKNFKKLNNKIVKSLQ